jgi:hypothetical protein
MIIHFINGCWSSIKSNVFIAISALSTTKSLPESVSSMNLEGLGLNQLFNYEICFKTFLLLAVSFLLADDSEFFCSVLLLPSTSASDSSSSGFFKLAFDFIHSP